MAEFFMIRVPIDLRKKLEAEAKKQHRSMTGMLAVILYAYFGGTKP